MSSQQPLGRPAGPGQSDGLFVAGLSALLGSYVLLIAGLLLALAMGALGGLLPAIAAMRLKPLESLR